MIFLDVTDLVAIAERGAVAAPLIRDLGLLHASAARPRAISGADEL